VTRPATPVRPPSPAPADPPTADHERDRAGALGFGAPFGPTPPPRFDPAPRPGSGVDVTAAHRMEERRELRRLERRRRRGGEGRGPVPLQRVASAIVGVVDEARVRAGRAVRGDRPLLVALIVLVIISFLVLAGPAQSYLDGQARVETLEVKAEALTEANAELEQRATDLRDPLNVELLARETQGFVAPGEVPYTLVPPEVDRPRITSPRDTGTVEADVWYQRAWAELRALFGG
jgi:cell division protein FtsB